MFKKYLLNQLTDVSAWIGLAVIVAALLLPRSFIVFLGILLILTNDEHLKSLVTKLAAEVKSKIGGQPS